MFCLFADLEDGIPVDGSCNGDGWQLRTYASRGSLVEIHKPSSETILKPFPVTWQPLEEDFPAREDAVELLGRELYDRLDYGETFGRTAEGSKVGGWPFLVQSELYWAPFNRHPANPSYVFQIDSEPKAGLSWGHQGILYVGRGTGASVDTWAMTWQCL